MYESEQYLNSEATMECRDVLLVGVYNMYIACFDIYYSDTSVGVAALHEQTFRLFSAACLQNTRLASISDAQRFVFTIDNI